MATSAVEAPVVVAEPTAVSQLDTKSAISSTSGYGQLDPERPLAKFALELPSILKEADYNEMYGVELAAGSDASSTPHPTLLILQKFLRANANNLPAARTQLVEALKWRKSYQPLAALSEIFPASKFKGLGYITTIHGAKETSNESDIATFNIYGGAASQNLKDIFGDTDSFVRWRVALMELTLSHLHLSSSSSNKLIPDYNQGSDPFQAIQIHDYQNISFFRQPPEIRALSTKIIELFQKYYPETVNFKYFVNVPLIMSWMMALMKGIMSKDSIQKMTWMTTGAELKGYLGEEIPVEYGGKGKSLKEVGESVKYDDQPATTTSTASELEAAPTATITAEKPVQATVPIATE